MSTLYLDRNDLQVTAESRHLRLRAADGLSTTVPMRLLERVVVRGRVGLDSSLLGLLAEAGIAITFLGARSHKRRAILLGSGGQDASRRLLQYRALHDTESKLQIARQVLDRKLGATLTGIDTMLEQRPDCRYTLLKSRRTIAAMQSGLPAGDCDTMLGLEGAAAHAWFQALAAVLPQQWGFTGRNRRPPRDPFNSCLSLAYTLIHSDACQVAWSVGLDPMLGFLHEPLHGRESLACDLVEPLRPRIDLVFWRAFAERRFQPHHFSETAQGCYLTKPGRQRFYPLWESHAAPWRRYLRLACVKLVKMLHALKSEAP